MPDFFALNNKTSILHHYKTEPVNDEKQHSDWFQE